MSYDHLLFNDDIDDDMTTQLDPTPTPSTPDDGATRFLEYYKSKGLSLDVAQRLVDGIEESGHFESDPVGAAASEFAVKVIANPTAYTTAQLALAKAYESQRERIADLEEDVERLRPREAWVPVPVFKSSSAEKEIEIECLGAGLLRVTVDDTDEGCAVDIDLGEVQSMDLSYALLKWSGVGGVEWTPIDSGLKPPGRLLLSNDNVVDVGHSSIMGAWNWDSVTVPTHWAPLPKPPVQS